MEYKPKVKAGRIQHLTDARYFAVWGPDYMSFALDEGSPDFVSPRDLGQITSWIEGPDFIGELGVHQTAQAGDIMEKLDLDGVQFHALARPGEFEVRKGKKYFFAPVVQKDESTDWVRIGRWAEGGVYIVLDLQTNRIDWTEFLAREQKEWEHAMAEWPVFPVLHPELHPVMEILTAFRPWGLEMRGSAEERLGVKSYEAFDPLYDQFEDKGWLVV